MARGMSGGWEQAEGRSVESTLRQRGIRVNWVVDCGVASHCALVNHTLTL